jgi:hypothetical protein
VAAREVLWDCGWGEAEEAVEHRRHVVLPLCDERALWLNMGLEQPKECVGAGNEGMWKLTAKGGKWVGQKDVKETDVKAVSGKKGKVGKGKWAKASKAGKHMGMAIDA